MADTGEPQAQMPDQKAYALVAGEAKPVAAPTLDYRPPMPSDRSIPIGLVGAGGISAAHLDAYRKFGLNVVAICDRHLDRAEARRDEYFPGAEATDRIEDVVGRPEIRVLDLTLHPRDRAPLIERALGAGQHVLSQKPFVHDLAVGEALVTLADRKGLQLAVNQNGRWAPHMSYMREAVAAGLVGEVTAVRISIQWDHTWIAGTRFAEMPQVILEDFSIHWFDFLTSLIGDAAETVFAATSRAHGQAIAPGLLAQVLVTFPGGQASLAFDANAAFGAADTTVVVGTRGLLRSTGPDLGRQTVRLYTAEGVAEPALEGQWFSEGFAGTMGALLQAVETGGPPIHCARDNLAALRLCQGAIESATTGAPVRLR
ncbi:MAG TPA: Gfo/Idh/MocA family oxidoreductase [Lichenihabitans sp.]|jgi:predicted dehydrogenase|nr:Gfo/Idh/MocA family oxidoreductase [Lichenihabitans sp.]